MIFLSKYVVLLEDISDLVSPLASSPSVLGWGGGIFIVFAMYTAKWEGRGGGHHHLFSVEFPFPPLLFTSSSSSSSPDLSSLPPSLFASPEREREKKEGEKNFLVWDEATFLLLLPRSFVSILAPFFSLPKVRKKKKLLLFLANNALFSHAAAAAAAPALKEKKGGLFLLPFRACFLFHFFSPPPPSS